MRYFRVFDISWAPQANNNCPSIMYIVAPESINSNDEESYVEKQLIELTGYKPIEFGLEIASERMYNAREDDYYEM